MIQLRPHEKFPISYIISDPTDTNTYYVQAVITDARSGNVIDTVNLTDNGDRTFSYNWTVPVDGGGEGRYINIKVSTYTDSGYTTKSTRYEEMLDTYLIQERVNPNLGMGGGGVDIDYKKIEKIIDKKLRGYDQKKEFNKVLKAILPLEVIVKNLNYKLEATERGLINKIEKSVETLPTPEKINLKPTEKRIKNLEKSLNKSVEKINEDLKGKINNREKKLIETLDSSLQQILSELDKSKKSLLTDDQEKVDGFLSVLENLNTEINFLKEKAKSQEPKEEFNLLKQRQRKRGISKNSFRRPFLENL